MRKRKICFIAQFPPPMHGLSKAVETLYNSFLAKEFDFEKTDLKNNKRFIENIFLIFRSKADLFYFTISQTKGGNFRDLIILKLLRMQNKRCLIHLHGGYYRHLIDIDLPKWQRKQNYKEISALTGAIVLGPSLKCIFEGMLPPSKIFMVPNCIDNTYLMSIEELKRKIIEVTRKKIKNVLYLSNFISTKGYPEVLELAKLEKKQYEITKKRTFHFNFAGNFFEKEEKAFFFEFIKDNELDDFVTYHGVVDGKVKKQLLKECDIFILLTRYPNEGQPISILEAMGNGMIIVTTNHAGIPDIVSRKVNIIVDCKPLNIQSIYRNLKKINENHLKKIMSTNYSQVINLYSQDKYIKTMQKVFGVLI